MSRNVEKQLMLIVARCQHKSLSSAPAKKLSQCCKARLTVAEVGLSIEHAAHNESANVAASGLYRLTPLQNDHWQPCLGQFQRGKEPRWSTAKSSPELCCL